MRGAGNIPVYMGRWQPWHSGHHYVATALLAQYGCLTIGIVNPDTGNPTEKYERFHPKVNPFTYWQRVRMIERAFARDVAIPGPLSEIVLVPIWGMATSFKREQVFLPPPDARIWVISHVREDSVDKIDILRRMGVQFQVIRDVPTSLAMIEASIIRDLIARGSDEWKSMVPVGTAEVLQEQGARQAISDAAESTWPSYLE